VGPPDFLIVGAQRSGTTWLYWLVTRHPGVHEAAGRRSELHVFDRMWDRWPTAAEIERYGRFFPRPPGTLVGEKTPSYMGRHWVPPMIRAAAPETRLIAILRDPVERYRSGVRNTGEVLAKRGMDPSNLRSLIAADAFQRGLYGAQIARYMELFPAEQLLVLQFERVLRDLQGQLDRVSAHLGLEPFILPADAATQGAGRSHGGSPQLAPESLGALVDAYAPDVRALREMVPDLDLGLWPNFTHLRDARPKRGRSTQPGGSATGAAARPKRRRCP
jgi:Sulfotransferase domain